MGASGERNRMGGLDLLRAIAVVLVVLYHADHLLSGGLLGVSVFFTLSGFLITGQVWRELSTGSSLDLGGFWSRRVRRLLPASIITLAVIVTVWPALGYELPVRDIVSSLLPVRNWEMLRSSTAYGGSPSPTIHFWSLAVEEQAYLVLPFLLLGLARLRRPGLAIGVLGAGAVASLGWAGFLAADGRLDRAYLGTDTRVGEILVGAALAVWLAKHPDRRPGHRAAAVLGTLGFGLIAALAVVVEWPSTTVSTVAIPLTVLAATMVCAASAGAPSWLDRCGRRRDVGFLAEHAYELYLVHVPVFAVLTTYRTGLTGGLLLAARLIATVLGATVLHRLVEPVRRRQWLRSPRVLVGTLGSLVLVVAVGAVAVQDDAARTTVATSASSTGIPTSLALGGAVPIGAGSDPARPSPGPVAETASAVENASATSSGASNATSTMATPAVDTEPVPAANSIWMVGDSTLRELDDPTMTDPTLSGALAAAGWRVSGAVGIRALATCGERPLDDPNDDLPPVVLPAAATAMREWYDIAPAATVLIQLGSNDLTQFDFSDDELGSCITATLDSLPPDVTVFWSLPEYGPWCWCDVDRAHADAERFASILGGLAAVRPNLRLLTDPLSLEGVDQRETLAEDGIHASKAGRSLRVAGLVAQLGPPPA